MIKRLPDNCISLYANLLQKTMDSRNVPLSGGSFVSKKIGESVYWYYQTKDAGATKQKYLGKESEALLDGIERAKRLSASSKSILGERARLVAMLGAGGAFLEKGRPAKILSMVSDAGLFHAGGVLVGSFAFACYGNMLGVVLDSRLSRTEDMDFSVEREMEIGISRPVLEDLHEADPTFRNQKQINPSLHSFDTIASDGFKVEFLTTKNDVHDRAPVLVKRFALYAQPLEFMDYLIEDAQQAVILSGAGIPVMVPNPARFALHKLAVSQLRPPAYQAKITKDLAQADSLLKTLMEDNPGSVLLASDALKQRSDALIMHVADGARRLGENGAKLIEYTGIQDYRWDTGTGSMVDQVNGGGKEDMGSTLPHP